MRCSIFGCKSDSGTKMPNLSFHSFPDNAKLRQRWIVATGRTGWIPRSYSKICSKHFEAKCLIKKNKRTLLLHNAVPISVKPTVNRRSSDIQKLPLCRVCLSEDVQYVIDDHLRKVYKKLTALPLQTTDMKPESVCYMCYALLNKCHKLMLRCLRADSILTQMLGRVLDGEVEVDDKEILSDRLALTASHLRISAVELTCIDSAPKHDDVKQEIKNEQDVDMKDVEIPDAQNEIKQTNYNIESSVAELTIQNEEFKKKIAVLEENIKEDKKYITLLENRMEDLQREKAANVESQSPPTEQSVNDKSGLQNHTNISEKEYNCNICNENFENSSTLEVHMNIHTDEVNSTSNSQTKVNPKKHSKKSPCNTPLTCHICQKNFKNDLLLRRHHKVHTTTKIYTNVKLFACNVCEEAFTELGLLQRHITAIHTAKVRNACTCMHKKNSNENLLKR